MSVRDLTILGSSSQQPTRRRNHGAYLLRWNDEGLLFDPGEGTQRQFIYANIAPPVVTRIFVSHFHGDHCLGLGSMLMRLNLDKVQHEIHCYYPASGKRFFDRLRYGTIYHETIKVVEHPVASEGIVEDFGNFRIEAFFLEHGVDNIGWRISEPSTRKFSKEKLAEFGVKGPLVRSLENEGKVEVNGSLVRLENVSWIRPGDVFSYVSDTRLCPAAIECARGAKILLCESTYLKEHAHLAHKYHHMTSTQAAAVAKEAGAQKLILTHFSARYVNIQQFKQEACEIFPNSEVAEDMKVIPFPL